MPERERWISGVTLEFEFPDTGEGVTEGELLEWLVEEGDEVEEDQVLAEAETDKAVVDIPAPADGTVENLIAEPGDEVEVGEVILEMEAGGSGGDDQDEAEKEQKHPAEEEDRKEESGGEGDLEDEESAIQREEVLALPKVRKLAEEKGVNLEELAGDGRITEEMVLEAAGGAADQEKESREGSGPGSAELDASPSVRRLAREKDVDPSDVEGSGRGGEVLREDVLEAAGETEEESAEQESRNRGRQVEGEVERVEMSEARKEIASRMEESRFTAPHVTHVEKADVEELAQLKEREAEEVETHLTFLPFFVRAAQLALEDHPDLNAELDEESDEIVRYGSYDFNIAVDTDNGLMVPLVRDVDRKSIVELAEEIGEKAERAREGEMEPGEMEKGTFSITNLGVIGGESFTPIIYHPQTAILGIGAIRETAEVVGRKVEPRRTVRLSLSYDHRVVDGAEAARFLNDVVENLENPETMLVHL